MTIAAATQGFALERPKGRPAAPSIAWRRAFVPAALLLSIVPLLWPEVPPLLDLLNSMSRYRVALDYATSPFFRLWFDFHWVIVGNLGVDLPVAALAPLLGIEAATKLVVTAIPLLTVAGLALVAREIHGRVPLTAAFAFLFAYNFPLNFGFVNFCMSVALALLALGLWLRLGRLGRPGLRALLFVPVSLVVWLAHACGWGMMGVMIGSVELMGRRAAGDAWPRAIGRTALACTPLLSALVPMLAWSSSASFSLIAQPHFGFARKLAMLTLSLKNDVRWIDVGTVALVCLGMILSIGRRDIVFDRRLGFAGIMMMATFLAMPDVLLGSGYADLRIAPYALALLGAALRPVRPTRFTATICTIAVALMVARIGYQTASFLRLDREYGRQFAALDHIPIGSRVFGFARVGCLDDWNDNRMDHVNRMATVRRQAFSNDTWPPTTAQGLTVKLAMIAGYQDLDSEKLVPADCQFGHAHTMEGMLASLPPGRFDHLWLIDIPPRLWPRRAWLTPVWRGTNTILYRIAAPRARAGTPAASPAL